ncbi:response regulator [Phenylobacterium sp.]|uniref:response regulator n=1 Tax=Phenylobacterium sp. TaxID=1871053 RepID=UPI0035B00A20
MAPSQPRVNILVVDGNIGMRSILTAVLRALGFTSIHLADDGDEALTMIPKVKPDLIIADLYLPVSESLSFIRTLRADEASAFSMVPIIVATGHPEDAHVRACLAAGVDHLLAKPVTGRTLADRILRVINEDRVFVRTDDYIGPQRSPAVAALLAS